MSTGLSSLSSANTRSGTQVAPEPSTLSRRTELAATSTIGIAGGAAKQSHDAREYTAAFDKPRRLRRDQSPLLRLTIIAVSCMVFAVSSALAQQKPSEYQVEAAYLSNFGRFVEWPTNPTAPAHSFTICVLGHDPFGPILDATVSGETIGSKSVVARRISSAEDSANCQILFLSSSESARVTKILESLDKVAVLTVSDIPEFSQRGGMVQFVREGSRVRFEVNLTATQKAGLSPSSELLKVATNVRRSPAPAD